MPKRLRALIFLFLMSCSTEPDNDRSVQDARNAEKKMTNDGVDDPYLWLEEVEGERALDWVRGQNARSLGQLTTDSTYQSNLDQALEVLTSEDRIAYGSVRDGYGLPPTPERLCL